MKKTTILVAGGVGHRMASSSPKQFLELAGLPILMHTINRFIQYDPQMELILVLPQSCFSAWEQLLITHHYSYTGRLVAGGNTRYQSVKNGLQQATGELIAIHDGVRPLVSLDVIANCFQEAEKSGSAIPVLPINESLRQQQQGSSIPVDRSLYCAVQTPQVFQAALLKNAYQLVPTGENYTDDASLVQANGTVIQLVEGNRENIKLTYPEDVAYASFLLEHSHK